MTIFEQTGWVRPAPKAICQDLDVLSLVSVYTYDLKTRGFLNYVTARTGISFTTAKDVATGAVTCSCERMLELDAMSEADYRETSECNVSARGYRYTPAEIEGNVAIRRIRKAQVQDCWELFTAPAPVKSLPKDDAELRKLLTESAMNLNFGFSV